MATSLEKIPAAAKRMAVSVSQVYREVKAGRLAIVKLGARASALTVESVDTWIADRVAESKQDATARNGGA